MDTAKILTELRSERERIDRAIAALEALDSTTAQPRQTSSQPTSKPRGRRLSSAARKRMSEAQQKRWADKKNVVPQGGAKKAAKKSAKKGGLTAAGRRRLSELA